MKQPWVLWRALRVVWSGLDLECRLGNLGRCGQRQAAPDGTEPPVPAKELTFVLEQPETQAALWLPTA